jgi:hypothetical protein
LPLLGVMNRVTDDLPRPASFADSAGEVAAAEIEEQAEQHGG